MTRLEKVTNIAVIFVALIVAGDVVYDRLAMRRLGPQTTAPPELFSEQLLSQQFLGKPLTLPVSLAEGNKGTITLFVSKNCHFCTDSMDFYRRLATFRSNKQCDLKLDAVGPQNRETLEDIKTYLATHNLTVDGTAMANFSSLSISGTPTLILRDASHLVRGIWVGFLSAAKENEVISKVQTLCQD